MTSLPKWLRFVYELSGCGFESCCSQINLQWITLCKSSCFLPENHIDNFHIITRVRGQCRHSQYLWNITSWKLNHSSQYYLVLPAAIVTAELFKCVSIKYKETKKNSRKIPHTLLNSVFIFRLLKTWIHYHEDITCRWRGEEIAGSRKSLYCTWLNNIIGLVSKCIRSYILFLFILRCSGQ